MGETQNTPDADGGLDRVQELSWALLDDHINGEELAELEGLLLADDGARGSYVGCVQLHADLTRHFAPAAPTTTKSTPVLGFLGTDSGPLTGLNVPKS